jgi:hypothetical protein
MQTSKNRQARRWLALGTTCACGLGFAGCSKPSLELTHTDPSAHAAAEARAADAIDRSRDELAAQDRRAGGATSGVAKAPVSRGELAIAGDDDAPVRESRFRMPFSRMFGSDRTKDSKLAQDGPTGEDPFLAAAPVTRKPAAPQSIAKKSDPVEDFLREQRPVGVNGRASVVSYEEEDAAAEPAPKSATAKTRTTKTADTSSSGRLASSSREPITKRTESGQAKRPLESKPGASTVKRPNKVIPEIASEAVPAKKSAARPFPTGDLLADDGQKPAAPAHRVVKKTELTRTKPSAAKAKSRNPLVVEELPAPESESQPDEQSSIAGLLDQSRKALSDGDHAEALQLAVDAQRRAATERHVFKAGDSRPDDVIAAISAAMLESRQTTAKLAEASPAGRARTKAAAVSWSGGASDSPADDPGDTRHAVKSRPPVWPQVAVAGNSDSNQLWQPSAGIAHIPDRDSAADLHRQEESRFAEQVGVRRQRAESSGRKPQAVKQIAAVADQADAPPLVVELGAPTPYAPEAFAAGGAPATRPSRLVAPPPLAIESGSQVHAIDEGVTVAAVKPAKKSRTVWYALLAVAMSIAVLAFRRRAYGSHRS